MDERRVWTAEQLEALETFRSRNDAAGDPALASMAETLAKDPELAQRLDCVLKWDARLTEAMRDVPVPPALAEQIIQSLDDMSPRPMPAPDAAHINRRSRRGAWITVAAGIGVAAVLIAVTVFGRVPSMSPERLRSIACDRSMANQGIRPPGSLVTSRSFPDRFPYSPELFFFPQTRWRRITDFDRAEAVAYDIPLGPGQNATLYVVRCRSGSLPRAVPSTPQTRTPYLAISAWQGDGVVYVVVVEGDDPAYRAILKSRPQGLT
jgi:hypothetical protein